MKKCIYCFLLILVACGGGGSGGPAATSPPPAPPPPAPPPPPPPPTSTCQAPTEFPVRGPVAPPVNWVIEEVETNFPSLIPNGSVAFDMDVDGDVDLLLVHTAGSHSTPTEGQPPAKEQRVWLNEGLGVFVDGTDAILGGETLPLAGIWEVRYRDFTGDGIAIVKTDMGNCDQQRVFVNG